jgi:hypothetical protein
MRKLEQEAAHELRMNDIASVEFEAASPLFFDPYTRNRATGSFILIDPLSNATVGAAMIQRDLAAIAEPLSEGVTGRDLRQTPLTVEDRYARHGHEHALILVQDRPRLGAYVERALFGQGFEVLHVSAADLPDGHLRSVLKLARSAGLVVILSWESLLQPRIPWETLAAEEGFEAVFDLAKQSLPEDDAEAVAAVLSLVGPLRTSNP